MKKTAIILSILALTVSSCGQTTKANLPEINGNNARPVKI